MGRKIHKSERFSRFCPRVKKKKEKKRKKEKRKEKKVDLPASQLKQEKLTFTEEWKTSSDVFSYVSKFHSLSS